LNVATSCGPALAPAPAGGARVVDEDEPGGEIEGGDEAGDDADWGDLDRDERFQAAVAVATWWCAAVSLR
jgi:hypothetical protein